jgi:dephospho-CoA kinase
VRLRVGLTGGIGAGKSEVAERFVELGALVIDADELARDAVAAGSDGLRAVFERWPKVRAADGSLDRAALAAVVFADPDARAELDGIVHPIVRRLAAEREAEADDDDIVVHEVPLLFETGYGRRCDVNVLVVAPDEERIERVMARSDLNRDDIRRRMRAQIDPERARELADLVIENAGTLDDLREAVDEAWAELLAWRSPPT